MSNAVRLADPQHYATSSGARVPRVSSVLDLLADGDVLKNSLRREREHVVSAAASLHEQYADAPATGFRFALEQAVKGQSAMAAFANERAEQGTQLHAQIAGYLERGSIFTGDANDAGAFRAFLAFSRRIDQTIAIERPLASEEDGFGGTLDWCGVASGRPGVVDWKRTSRIRLAHKMQVSAYHHLAVAHGLIPYDSDATIVRLNEDGSCDPLTLTRAQIDHYFTAFYHLLGVYLCHEEDTRPPAPAPPPTAAPRAIAPKAVFSFTRRSAA